MTEHRCKRQSLAAASAGGRHPVPRPQPFARNTNRCSRRQRIVTLCADVTAAARSGGVAQAGFAVHHLTRRAVLFNRPDQMAAKVLLEPQDVAEAAAALMIATTAATAGAPVLAPLRSDVFALPHNRAATFWPLAQRARGLHPGEIGRLVANLHTTPAPADAPRWDAAEHAARYGASQTLAAAVGQPARLQRLRELARRACDARGWPSPTQSVLVHRDVYPSNMVQHGGELVLCDLDTLCSGPPEVDLACMAVHCHRVLGPGAWGEFMNGYGLPYDHALLRCLTAAKEIAYVQWPLFLHAVGVCDDRAAMIAEYERRVDTALEHPDVLWADL